VVGSAITVVICVIVMVVVEWQLALVTVATLPLLVLTLRRARRPVYRTRRDLQERLAAFTVHAQEVLSL
jgi:ABC-type multidrug transport system fused ATPase/permease subunit